MASGRSFSFNLKNQLRLLGGRKLLSPKGIATRPTTARVREAIINILREKIEGCHWLDLCSGSGIMSCEALQKGAKRVVAVEKDKETSIICKANLMSIANSQNQKTYVKVICHEVISFLKEGCPNKQQKGNLDNRFDLVYFDPPYGSRIYSSVLKGLIEGNWLKEDSLVIFEHSSSTALEIPYPWIEKDKRIYGSSALLLMTPQCGLPADTDSMLQRIGLKE